MAHDRRAGGDQQLDLRCDARPALELHGVRAALLEEADRGPQRLLGGCLVGAERQVRHDERPGGRADHRAHHRQQLVDGDRHGRGVAEHVVAGRVTDQQDRHVGRLEDPGGEHVVGGEHRPALTALLGALQVARADAAVGDTAVQGRQLGHGGPPQIGTRGRPPRAGVRSPDLSRVPSHARPVCVARPTRPAVAERLRIGTAGRTVLHLRDDRV